MKKRSWQKYNNLVFRASFILFVILFALEYLVPGVVTSLFNPVFILIIVGLSGILAVVKN